MSRSWCSAEVAMPPRIGTGPDAVASPPAGGPPARGAGGGPPRRLLPRGPPGRRSGGAALERGLAGGAPPGLGRFRPGRGRKGGRRRGDSHGGGLAGCRMAAGDRGPGEAAGAGVTGVGPGDGCRRPGAVIEPGPGADVGHEEGDRGFPDVHGAEHDDAAGERDQVAGAVVRLLGGKAFRRGDAEAADGDGPCEQQEARDAVAHGYEQPEVVEGRMLPEWAPPLVEADAEHRVPHHFGDAVVEDVDAVGAAVGVEDDLVDQIADDAARQRHLQHREAHRPDQAEQHPVSAQDAHDAIPGDHHPLQQRTEHRGRGKADEGHRPGDAGQPQPPEPAPCEDVVDIGDCQRGDEAHVDWVRQPEIDPGEAHPLLAAHIVGHGEDRAEDLAPEPLPGEELDEREGQQQHEAEQQVPEEGDEARRARHQHPADQIGPEGLDEIRPHVGNPGQAVVDEERQHLPAGEGEDQDVGRDDAPRRAPDPEDAERDRGEEQEDLVEAELQRAGREGAGHEQQEEEQQQQERVAAVRHRGGRGRLAPAWPGTPGGARDALLRSGALPVHSDWRAHLLTPITPGPPVNQGGRGLTATRPA